MANTRMAGDALAKGGRKKSELEQRLGTNEFRRIGAEGHQDPTNSGRWSAAEVKAEFRNSGASKVDEGEDSIVNRFKDIQANGGMFNKKAQTFLANKYGFDFTKNNTNDGNAPDGTNTGGDPSDNTGGGTEPGDGGVTPQPETPVTPVAPAPGGIYDSPGAGSRGGDASNTNKTDQFIGDSTITNSPGASITNNNTNNNFQQSFGGSYKNFTYNGGGGGSGSAPSAQTGLYDTPASMATMAGYWGVDDSPESSAKFISGLVGQNRFHQAVDRADYNARTNFDYKAQADSMNQFNPQAMQERIDQEPLIDRARADVNFAKMFGDPAMQNFDWVRSTAPKPIETDLEGISEEYMSGLS